MNPIKISINKMALGGKLPSGDRRWGEFTKGFENKEIELFDLANCIYTGHAYGPWYNGSRSNENFVLAQHIAIDLDTMDDRSRFDVLLQNEFVATFAGLLHTTPSHTPQAPKARVIFFLDEPIKSADGYSAVVQFVMSQVLGTDEVCKDAGRFFYGAKGCQIEPFENVLPLAQLRHYYKRWTKTRATQTAPDMHKVIQMDTYRNREPMPAQGRGTSFERICDNLARTPEGGRNAALNKAAFMAAKFDVADQGGERALAQIGVSMGLTETESIKTARSGWRAGESKRMG